jgi:hypothetical protein
MWRMLLANGQTSDMANRTRAKNAAVSLALSVLNKMDGQETPSEAPPVRQNASGVSEQGGAP